MWWKKGGNQTVPPSTPTPTPAPSPSPYTFLGPLLQQYATTANQMQNQYLNAFDATRGQFTSGWGPTQSTLPPANLALIALSSATGKKPADWLDDERVYLEKATHFLEAFFTKGNPHDWEAFLSICAAAKSGNMELLKGTTTAALLGEKKNG